ncbi:MAG TPA: DUF6676 family protein [Gaiellaceae bacterium]|nr:DUF6676 family protein [Gaiellaceae bacterium]
MLRPESRRRERLPGRISLISDKRAGLRAGPLLVGFVIAALASASGANAHGPTTAIGRAVAAFASVPVSYDPGAAVSDVEAGNFPTIVGANTKVAFMPASASSELAGGPDAIADEVAREAELDGTLVVLVGPKLGTWSDDIGDERLVELEREAQVAGGGSPAATVEALVRGVQAEPADSSTPWALLGIVLLVAAAGAVVLLHRLGRRPRAAA